MGCPDPAAIIVSRAERSEVDAVFVRDLIRKRRGSLVDADLPRLSDAVVASRERLNSS